MEAQRKESKSVAFWMDVRLLAEIDELAKKAGLSRNQLVMNILGVGLDALKGMDKVGVLRFSVLMRDLCEKVGNRFVEVQEEAVLRS